LVVSLGTSDTVFGVTQNPLPSREGHIFVSPFALGSFVGLCCFSNGSLAREAAKMEFCQGKEASWEHFDELVNAVAPGCDGLISAYWSVDEITPRKEAGKHFYCTKTARSIPVESVDAAKGCRAMIEGQMLRLALYSKSLGMQKVSRIICCGGGSVNRSILEILSNVMGCDVYQAGEGSAALGGCYRAVDAVKRKEETSASFSESLKHISGQEKLCCSPNMELHKRVYLPLLEQYQTFVDNV
jgi:xylulokinase